MVSRFKNIMYYVSVVIAVLILTTTLLSLLTDTSWRYLKMLDFPRIQYFIFGGIMLVIFVWITEKWKWYDILFASMIVASMVLQSTYLVHYTFLVSKAVPDATKKEEGLKLVIYNLYFENDCYEDAIRMLDETDADILVTFETTPTWENKLASLKKEYPYTTETINKVSYGMTIYSKFEMQDLEKHYLNNKKVPSYSFKIQIPNKPPVQIHTLHPPPPKQFKKLPDNAGQKEKAMTMIGDEVKKNEIATIVMGDFNDVAWGNTQQLVQAGDRLYDIRVGRGFYNSFNAHNFLMRWPLDHVFVTEHFALKDIQLLDNACSDHYPVYVELSYK